MSTEKTYTEREKVMIQRAAFMEGVNAFNNRTGEWPGSVVLAHQRYPLPKVTRPRVWVDTSRDIHVRGFREFRFAEGQLQTRVPEWGETEWKCLSNGSSHATTHPDGFKVTPERIAAWADLMANPTEEVEAES